MLCIHSLIVLAIVLPLTRTAANQYHRGNNEALHAHILQHVTSKATADNQAAAAMAVIARTIGAERASAFVVRIDQQLQRNTFHLLSSDVPSPANRSVNIVASSGRLSKFAKYRSYNVSLNLIYFFESHRNGRLQRLPPLSEILLQLPHLMGWGSAAAARHLAGHRSPRDRGQSDHLLPERLHVVVQFRVVPLARVAPPHRLDGAERHHAVAGPGTGARLVGRIHRAGDDRRADRPAFRWAGVHGLAADGQYARLGRTAER